MVWYETERLILRNYKEKDTEDYYEYMSLESTALHEDFYPFSREESRRAVEERLEDDFYAGTFPTLQVGVFLYHVGVKIVLPLCEVGSVPDNLFGAQAVVLRQRNKGQMQMGRFLVHVYHHRHNIFFPYPLDKEVSRPLEKRLYLLWGLALEKLRTGDDERIDKPCAVLLCPAPSLFNAALNEVIVSALWLNNVKVVLAPAGVNVGIAGVLFFLPFVMGFQRSCRIALVFLKSQNYVLYHSAPFPIPFLSGTFQQENPARNISDRIGME